MELAQQTESVNSQKIQSLLEWLKHEGATGLEEVEIKPSPECNGSLGCFTKVARKKGDILAKIPKKCLIGLGDALQSDIVKKVQSYLEEESQKESSNQKEALDDANEPSLLKKTKKNEENSQKQNKPNSLSNELILWLFLSSEHNSTSPSKFKPYLDSLPVDSPIASSWEEDILESISDTNLGNACLQERQQLQDQINFLKKAEANGVDALKGLSDSLEWSKGNYLSRRFVGRLCNNGEGVGLSQYGGSMGCMVPFFDLLNHKQDHKVNFQHDEDSVWYVCEDELLPGDEVFNNYHSTSNEQLLFTYGFAVNQNSHDELLVKMMGQDKHGNKIEIGVFSLDEKGIGKDFIKAVSGQSKLSRLSKQEIGVINGILGRKQGQIEQAKINLAQIEVFEKQLDGETTNGSNNRLVRIAYLKDYLEGQLRVIKIALQQLQNANKPLKKEQKQL